jgi:hypothetical protein
LVTDEGGGPPQGGVHGGAARPEGNGGEGRRPVLEVGGSRLGKVVGTRAVIGAASTERVRGQRLLGSGRRLEQRQTVGGRAKRTRRERWSGDGSTEVKKSGFASEPMRAGDKDTQGGACGRPRRSSGCQRVAEQLARAREASNRALETF